MNKNEDIIYGYDGNIPLTKNNWKCVSCEKFIRSTRPCHILYDEYNNIIKKIYPNKNLEPTDTCEYYNNLNNAMKFQLTDDINVIIDNKILDVSKIINGKTLHAKVDINPNWNKETLNIAISKAVDELSKYEEEYSKEINMDESSENVTFTDSDNKLQNENNYLTEADKKQLCKTKEIIDKIITLNTNNTVNTGNEELLKGETKISWINQITSWKRVMNAARRTIGKKPLDKEPSDSWKAKILLAEHSPIRLLEYDWGWEKIRQWVTVHLVRHHEGVEKFVHSQRSDRRELPTDRDHLYQGAKNDMDMSANAQGLINMSRKRCCNCASPETREAWKLLLDELEKVDPVLRSKCVPECVYRGFCPEWMSTCKYYKTNDYKRKRADYVNTDYAENISYYNNTILNILITNTGKIYERPKTLIEKSNTYDNKVIELTKKEISELTEFNYLFRFQNGVNKVFVVCENGEEYYVDELVFNTFADPNEYITSNEILHIDGNEWNNNIKNLNAYPNNNAITK